MRGWHYEPYRHALAAKGISTRLPAGGTLTRQLPTLIQANWWKYRLDEYAQDVLSGEINDPFFAAFYVESGLLEADKELKNRKDVPIPDYDENDDMDAADVTDWAYDDDEETTKWDYYHRLWWYRSDDPDQDVKMVAYDTVTDWEILAFYGPIDHVESFLVEVTNLNPDLTDIQEMLESVRRIKSFGARGNLMVTTADAESYDEMNDVVNIWEGLGYDLALSSGSDEYIDKVMKSSLSRSFRGV